MWVKKPLGCLCVGLDEHPPRRQYSSQILGITRVCRCRDLIRGQVIGEGNMPRKGAEIVSESAIGVLGFDEQQRSQKGELVHFAG